MGVLELKKLKEGAGENLIYDSVDICGTVIGHVNLRTLFDKIIGETEGKRKKRVKKGTILGSAYKDELYILSEDRGMYFANQNRIILCDIKKIEKEKRVGGWSPETYIETRYQTSDLKVLVSDPSVTEFPNWYDTFVNLMVNDFGVDEDEDYFMERVKLLVDLEGKKQNTYYELEIEKDKVSFYVEFNGEFIALELEREPRVTNYWRTSRKFLKSLVANGHKISHENSLSEALETFKEKAKEESVEVLSKILEGSLLALDNGYVYNNIYYENLEEIYNLVENELQGEQEND